MQGIAADEGVGSYAKRKFGDLQHGRMENGRGKGWKKRSKWYVFLDNMALSTWCNGSPPIVSACRYRWIS